MATVTATTGTDNFTGTGGFGNTSNQADTIIFSNQNQVQANDTYNGGARTDTVRLDTSIDFQVAGTSGTNTGFRSIEALAFTGAFTATFRSEQFGAGLLSNSLALTGTTGVQTIIINLSTSAPTVNMVGWTFTNWSGGTDIIQVNGSTADDVIYVSSQHTVFDGGAGSDTIDYANWGGGFTLTLNGSNWVNATWTSGLYDTLRNVENVVGSTSNDTITGDSLDNALSGNAGNDTLSGGLGNDILDGGTGADTMTGGVGNDTYYVDDAGDVVIERASDTGTDLVYSTVTFSAAGTNQDGVENITLTGTSNVNATGNALNNVLTGNTAANVLTGGAGSDTYYVDNVGDVVVDLSSDAGTDLVYSTVAFSAAGANQSGIENITLTGTGNIDATGNGLANVLTGNTGNNVLDGGTGADTMSGGAGNDSYYVDNLSDVVVDLASDSGTDLVNSSVTFSAAGTNQSGIENITLTGTSAINATGNALANILTGNNAANVLIGGDGNDTLIGSLGSDTLTGDAGADLFVFSGYDASAAQLDVVTDFSIVDGDVIAFGATGPASFDVLSRWILRSKDGAAYLNTGFNGLSQSMTLTGVTMTSLTAANFSFDVSGAARVATGTSASDMLIGGLGDDVLTGGDGRDFLLGDAGSDTLTGGDGNDILDGGSGADVMTGGAGNDLYYVDNISDSINELPADGGIDTADTWVSYSFTGSASGIEKIYLRDSGNIDVTGNDLDNAIYGNSGNNRIDGGSGNDSISAGTGDDTVIGGSGNDTLSGGTGADVFEYALSSGTDVITDFNRFEDRLDLRAYGVDTAAELAPYASNSGTHLVIDFGSGNVITVNNLQLAQVTDSLFVV
jgi:Ca2+-binding RTX toxin-like protein